MSCFFSALYRVSPKERSFIPYKPHIWMRHNEANNFFGHFCELFFWDSRYLSTRFQPLSLEKDAEIIFPVFVSF